MANKLMAQLVVEPVVWDLPGPWAKVTGESSRVTFLNSTRFSNRMVNVELRLNTDPKIFISSTINGWQPLQIPTCHKLWTYYVIFTSIVTVFFFFCISRTQLLCVCFCFCSHCCFVYFGTCGWRNGTGNERIFSALWGWYVYSQLLLVVQSCEMKRCWKNMTRTSIVWMHYMPLYQSSVTSAAPSCLGIVC